MPSPPIKIGSLLIKGREFKFKAAPSYNFEAYVGDDPRFEVDYLFDENSLLQEHCIVRIRLAMPGDASHEEDAYVRDVPLKSDTVRGTIGVSVSLPKIPHVEGILEVEAFYARDKWEPWAGRGPLARPAPPGTSTFRWHQRFEIDHRPKPPPARSPVVRRK